MSFSVSWPDGVSQADATADMTLESALCSPPVEQLSDEVKEKIKEYIDVAASLISVMESQTNMFNISVHGHVRVDDSPNSVYISVSERVQL